MCTARQHDVKTFSTSCRAIAYVAMGSVWSVETFKSNRDLICFALHCLANSLQGMLDRNVKGRTIVIYKSERQSELGKPCARNVHRTDKSDLCEWCFDYRCPGAPPKLRRWNNPVTILGCALHGKSKSRTRNEGDFGFCSIKMPLFAHLPLPIFFSPSVSF